MKTSLELKHIGFAYGADPVLQNFSLSVEAGEMVVILGASGCGKSTVLKIVSGMIKPDEGEILFSGKDYASVAAEKREAVMMFQKPLLFPYLNVADNVAFGLRMRKFPKTEIGVKVNDALQLVQLSGFEKRMPGQLSGGQEQRVALARALVTQPRVLLLDEPLSALDANLRNEVRFLLRDLQQRLGITTVFVTHDQAEAINIADRIAFMNEGRIEQLALPRDFISAPKTPKAAEFFGWKVYSGQRQRKCIETRIGNFELPSDYAVDLDSRIVKVAFHPNNISLCAKKDSSSIVIQGQLLKTIYLGTHNSYLFKLKDGSVIQSDLSQDIPDNTQNGLVDLHLLTDSVRFF